MSIDNTNKKQQTNMYPAILFIISFAASISASASPSSGSVNVCSIQFENCSVIKCSFFKKAEYEIFKEDFGVKGWKCYDCRKADKQLPVGHYEKDGKLWSPPSGIVRKFFSNRGEASCSVFYQAYEDDNSHKEALVIRSNDQKIILRDGSKAKSHPDPEFMSEIASRVDFLTGYNRKTK